jgi:hypothetical protein
LFYLLVLLASVALAKGDFGKPLKEAATREELVRHFGTTIGFGEVEKWEFTTAGRKLMVFGHCPYSGRATCYVHAYSYQTAKHAWVLFLERVFEPATGLSAEISADHSLIFKDRGGKIVANHSIDALPK